MKYFQSTKTGTVFELIFRGENYVHGSERGKPKTFGWSATLTDGSWKEWAEEPQVGDKVKIKGKVMSPRTLLYIHQGKDDDRKFGVIAYEGDIPQSVWYKNLEKVDG